MCGGIRPFRPPGQGAAHRRAHETTAEERGWGNLGRFVLRGNARPVGVHTKQLSAGAGAGQPRSASASTALRTFAVGPVAFKCATLLRLGDMRRVCVSWGCRSGSAHIFLKCMRFLTLRQTLIQTLRQTLNILVTCVRCPTGSACASGAGATRQLI